MVSELAWIKDARSKYFFDAPRESCHSDWMADQVAERSQSDMI